MPAAPSQRGVARRARRFAVGVSIASAACGATEEESRRETPEAPTPAATTPGTPAPAASPSVADMLGTPASADTSQAATAQATSTVAVVPFDDANCCLIYGLPDPVLEDTDAGVGAR